ncbi:MAG: hypothetical protein C0618_06760 [Desulfuromonas sp.]|nr:MAG: hypothetical protein C0618_06760 [Desulfuromonas sp.]
MVIQCPECGSRYRAKNIRTDRPEVRIKCPKCTHVFSVPVRTTDASRQAPQQPAVLIVDDARFFCEILTDLLKPLGFELVTVGTGAAALDALRARSFRLALIDINLPDMSGLDLMRAIREDDAIKDVPILAMSGAYRRNECEVDALRAGADNFINKSFKPDQLLSAVRDLLIP